MNKSIFVLILAGLIGCSSKKDPSRNPDRYLYFTSKFPVSTYWEVDLLFETKRDIFLCKDFSMGHGGWLQKTKYEHYKLSVPTDTLKVPLFWKRLNLCQWELDMLSIDLDGDRIMMRDFYLHEKHWKKDVQTVPMPDSLSLTCKSDPEDKRVSCNPDNGGDERDFIMNDTNAINHLRIDVNEF